MPDDAFIRVFNLSPPGDRFGIHCGTDRACVGPIPLLDRVTDGFGRTRWIPRPIDSINRDLSFCYGLPVDMTARVGGFAAVANALNDGALVRAQIATLHLRLPDLPQIDDGTHLYERRAALAKALHASGLLKASPDDPEHPGWPAGTPGGLGGKFMPNDGNGEDPNAPPKIPDQQPITEKAKNLIRKQAARWLVRATSTALDVTAPEVAIPVQVAVEAAIWLAPYVKAYLDPPKTLEELQIAANDPQPGYDVHRIVEQGSAKQDGFPSAQIDAPDNLVLVPKLKHWEINAWYQRPSERFGGQTPRNYLRGKDWDERRRVGLDALKEAGVLKP